MSHTTNPQPGEVWVTRGGLKAYLASARISGCLAGAIQGDDAGECRLWLLDGRFRYGEATPFDLVTKCVPEKKEALAPLADAKRLIQNIIAEVEDWGCEDYVGQKAVFNLRIALERLEQIEMEKVPEPSSPEREDGYYWLEAERSSAPAIAQWMRGMWHCIGEGMPITAEAMTNRGWDCVCRVQLSETDEEAQKPKTIAQKIASIIASCDDDAIAAERILKEVVKGMVERAHLDGWNRHARLKWDTGVRETNTEYAARIISKALGEK